MSKQNEYQKLALQYNNEEINKEQYIKYCRELDKQFIKPTGMEMAMEGLKKAFENGAVNPRTGI
jgi:hypothetical protein